MRTFTMEAADKNIPTNKENDKSLFGWIRFTLLIGVLFLFFRFAIGLEIISGNSMNPTIEDNNVLLINKMFFTPNAGDIVVIEDPHGYSIIKRIIGMPGDKLAILDGVIHINGVPLKEDYAIGMPNDLAETTIPDERVFVIGDNRTPGESLDSRDQSIGPVPLNAIIGEAAMSILPLGKISKD